MIQPQATCIRTEVRDVQMPKSVAVQSWMAFALSLAYAQASITGTVKDSSGAILPDVTAEAASPVLNRESPHGGDG